MKDVISHMEDYGLDSVSNEVLLKSFIIHPGLNVERTNQYQKSGIRQENLPFKLIVPHDRVSVNHL